MHWRPCHSRVFGAGRPRVFGGEPPACFRGGPPGVSDTMAPVSSERMAAADAQLLWLSAKVPNDQFLVYVFDGVPDIAAALDDVRRTAERCDELRLRVCGDGGWRYPRWVRTAVRPEQFVVHPPPDSEDWRACLQPVAGLGQLDPAEMTWRLHVYPPSVVVVQMSHALGDGVRSAALAAALLGRRGPLPEMRLGRERFLPAVVRAARTHREMVREIEAGSLAASPGPRPVLSVNTRSEGGCCLRTVVCESQALRRPTVTVAALVAVAEALGGYLAARGEDVSVLGSEVPVSGDSPASARNNFRNVNIGLYPHLDRDRRATRIAGELRDQRRRAAHPASAASAAATAALPAPVLRWGTSRFDPNVRSTTVSGHTVVSSVNRGSADLTFGGRPVLVTAGYPALSPMMSLTHGVHGIGDVIALSVRADAGVVQIDDYVDRLTHALHRPL